MRGCGCPESRPDADRPTAQTRAVGNPEGELGKYSVFPGRCSTGGPIKTLRFQRTPLRTAQISPRTIDKPIIRAMRGVLGVRDSRILRDKKKFGNSLGLRRVCTFREGT